MVAAASLGDVAEFVNGAAFKPEDWGSDGLPIIRIQNLTDPTKAFNRTLRTVPDRLRVRAGDLLVSWSATLGVFEWAGPGDGLLNQHIFRVLPDKSKIDKRYLRHGLERAITDMQMHLHGATMQHVNRGEFLGTQLYLPSISEQRRIAEVLDRAETLRAQRRQALAQLDALAESIFESLSGNSRGSVKTIGELLSSGALLVHKDGNHGSLYPRADDFVQVGVPFISARAIRDDGRINDRLIEHLHPDKAAKLRLGWIIEGDVLLSHNASVGKVACYDGRFKSALIGTSLTAFRPNPQVLTSAYLTAALRSSRFQRSLEKNMGQTTRNQVPITAQRDLQLSLPPLEVQRKFANQIEAVERAKALQHASLASLDALFASLQHRAFRGEL